MRVEKYSEDNIIGELVGEIIWDSKLSLHTENHAEEKYTEDEKTECERLYKYHSSIWDRNKPTPESDAAWKAYRGYVWSLLNKYLPNKVEYSRMICWEPKKPEDFYKGIEDFLWNTDNCCYEFSLTDIVFEKPGIYKEYPNVWTMKITFKLSH